MRWWMAVLAVAAAVPGAVAQEQAQLSAAELERLQTRILQLMESTTAVVPGLARAAAPVMENARQSSQNLKAAPVRDYLPLQMEFLRNVRAFLELSDALPKPFPFPPEGKRQFTELRETLDRIDASFLAALEARESQLRSPDRDQLRRYAEANQKLPPPQPGRPRVVFLGDSITDGWRLNEYFPDRDFVNRGIGGQITSQMLARMKADVIDLKPQAVVFLGGTNDIARGIPLQDIENNISMIADLCELHRIRLIPASVLPVHDYNKDRNPAYEMTRRRPMEKIAALNRWLEAFARERGLLYLDYSSAMMDEKGYLKADYADDGLHPNAAGYRIMAPLALAAVDKTVKPGAPVEPPKRRRFPF